ncbi:MAG: FAD-dependent oxidoreductase [Bryobacteraceae bacterium]
MPRYEAVTSRYERFFRSLFAVTVKSRMLRVSIFAAFLWALPLLATERNFDVVVYGGTAGGAMAAVAAAQHGLTVALLEPGNHIGGMVSGGLSNSDVDRQEALVGGLTLKFFRAIGKHYGKPVAWAFEPHVAEQTFNETLGQARVHTFFRARLAKITKSGSQMQSLSTENGDSFSGKIFLDAGYEGDLMKAAGVSYTVGREGVEKYRESLAGRQDLLPGRHQFVYPVSAAAASSDSLPYVVPQEKVAPTGSGDGHFQSYCFRLCLTEVPDNGLPIKKPSGYRPSRFELVRRYIESGKGALGLRDFVGIVKIPNGKADINSTGPVSTDVLGASWAYPEASYEQRKQIWDEHLTWAQGLMYFLQNDSSVPGPLRSEARHWNLPKDEFPDTGHWPHQLYIREGRRMLGEYVLTQHDLEEYREKYDAIGMAGYNIDIREVQWLTHKVYHFPNVIDQVFTEGYLSMPVQPWQVPYRALLPRQEQCSNLLVTATVSASTIAYASFRMEANYMMVGESAGVAAALAIKTNRPVHQIDIAALQKELQDRNQILSSPKSQDPKRGSP